MTNKTYTMIDPKQIARKGYKGCKTTTAVQNFCKTNNVDCCIWKPQGSTQKVMMIEWNSFRNAYKANQTNTASMKTTKSKSSRATGSNVTSINSGRNRTTSRTTNRTTSRTTNGAKGRTKTRTTARKTNTVWGTTQTRKTNNARRTNTGAKMRRAA